MKKFGKLKMRCITFSKVLYVCDLNAFPILNIQPLNGEEQAIIAKSLEIIEAVPTIPCTKCKYCVDDCPQKINIPGILSCVNLNTIYRNREKARGEYTWVAGGERGYAKDCIGCGACENICPQHIAIIEELKKASELLD